MRQGSRKQDWTVKHRQDDTTEAANTAVVA
jgi:hypothetical protein